ncbi:MAG TPA: hypothetical protein VK886_02725 [Vicinamibacterales bacterium]|nr:hypothetical protein [Vicinamibacterales bacterium]
MEVADVRRKFRARIEEARRASELRRGDLDRASHEYDTFLHRVAVPAFRLVASVLSAEGYPFKVFTPANGVRLASTTSREDYFEVELDTDSTPPQVIGRANRARGGRVTTVERPIRDGKGIGELTEEDVVEFVLAEFGAFV